MGYVIKSIDGAATWRGRWIDGQWFFRLLPYEHPSLPGFDTDASVTILALDCPADGTMEDLQRLVEGTRI